MWQAPNQRVEALQNAKKRRKERMDRPIHIRRARAEVRMAMPPTPVEATSPSGTPIEARVLLNDFSSKGVGVYVTEKFHVGQEVTLTIHDPTLITISGRVAWCQDQPTSHTVVSANSFKYRAGVEFIFKTPEEEAAVKAIYEELRRQHIVQD
jgi:Tfp pilus assembly protein PilZ